MRKIANIDSIEVYSRTGESPFHTVFSRRRRPNPVWFDLYFTEPQKRILVKHGYVLRPHPRHSPTVELFINEQGLTDRDWTLIHLLFN